MYIINMLQVASIQFVELGKLRYKTKTFRPMVIITIWLWLGSSYLPDPVCHKHMYGVLCVSHDPSLPQWLAPPGWHYAASALIYNFYLS